MTTLSERIQHKAPSTLPQKSSIEGSAQDVDLAAENRALRAQLREALDLLHQVTGSKTDIV